MMKYTRTILLPALFLAGLPVAFAQIPFAPDLAATMDPIKLQLTAKDQERDYLSDLQIIAQDTVERRKGWRFEKLYRGDASRKMLALTIDDGPHPLFTPGLLAALKQLDIPATFFVIGEEAQFNPDLIKAEVAAGHQVSNHTYHHARLNHVMPDLIAPEIAACDAVISRITGKPADPYLRPPGGEYDADVITACRELGKTIVMYTDDPADYANPAPDLLFERTMKHASNGGILLFHDGVQETIDQLPRIVNALKARGYRFVTISELDAASRPRAIRDWQKKTPLPPIRTVPFPKPRKR
ncbi:MAG TPA: polysaccharide deacetylase family protein [Armatimonadota bacterium]|jgi:peptidoglycan/xylan/chitin deacetylase (PgdA/CDA1 family)